MSSCVHRKRHLFQWGCPEGAPFSYPVQCLECFQPGVWTTVRRERERLGYAGKAARLEAPFCGPYPKDNEKLMGYKCVCVWWTDLHFEKITLVAAWETGLEGHQSERGVWFGAEDRELRLDYWVWCACKYPQWSRQVGRKLRQIAHINSSLQLS